jgi:hypothetical protein
MLPMQSRRLPQPFLKSRPKDIGERTMHLNITKSAHKKTTSKSIRRNFRPTLEALEAREVPSGSPPVITSGLPDLVDGPNQQLQGTVTVEDGHPASSLTWQASFGTNAFLLDQQLGFVDTTNFHFNWSGTLNEKWVRDANGAWYFILRDGELHRWNVSATRANPTGPLVATLDPIYFFNPRWLTDADNPADAVRYQAAQDQAFVVESALKLQDPNATGGLRENLRGHDERYLMGTNVRTGKSNQFFILPNGYLYQWMGTYTGSLLVARLDPMYYQVDMLRQLTQTAGTPDVTVGFNSFSSNTYSNTLFIAPTGYRGTLWGQVMVSNSDGTAFSRIFQISFRDHSPVLFNPGTVSVTSGSTTSFNLHGSDPDPGDSPYLTYNIGFAADALDTLLQLPSGTQLPRLTYIASRNNYGGMGTRWFRDASQHWYFQDQTGAFFKWGGMLDHAAGTYLGMLPLSYWNNPMTLQADSRATAPAGAYITVDSTGRVTVTMPDGFKGKSFAVLAWQNDGLQTTVQRFLISVK